MSSEQKAKKIFLSSTCLDLIDVRAELKRALEELGYVVYVSEMADFPVNVSLNPVDNCLAVVKNCDIYILIIHTRYGSRFDGVYSIPNLPEKPPGGYVSVTLAEFLVAKASGLETRVWVRDSIWDSRPIFRALAQDKQIPSLPGGVDPTVYDFLDYIQESPKMVQSWINPFHDIVDLKESVSTWLRATDYVNDEQFKREVVDLFHLHGYHLDQAELLRTGSRRALADSPTDPFRTKYAVWTHFQSSNRTVQWSDIETTVLQIQSDLSAGDYDKAFLILSTEYHQDVPTNLTHRRLQKNIRVESYSELLYRLIDFRPYLQRIVYDYEHYNEYTGISHSRDPVISIMRRCNLYRYFVPLRARSSVKTVHKFDGDLEPFVRAWIQSPDRNQLTLLGDFGTGKSSFALWLTYELSKNALQHELRNERIPLFISLRDHAGKIDVSEILTNTLANTYGISNATYRALERLLESGHVVVIFDGFDETATLTDRATTLRILRSLNSLVRRRSKVILTCRTHYFRTEEETHKQLRRSMKEEETELFIEQKGRRNFELVYLQEFRRDQIEMFLEKHYGGDREKARSMLAKMQLTYNLPDLSRRPVMLEMILKVWPQLLERSKEQEITPALLYREYVESWINIVAKGNEDLMDSETKKRFCENLSRWLYMKDREVLPYAELEQVVRDFFADRPPAAYAALDTEVRTCTFLNRDSVGNYQFAHRSFMEFFIAKACAEEFDTGNYDLLHIRPLSREIITFLRGMISDCGLLWNAIIWTKGKGKAAGYVGGNAGTLLTLFRESFKNVDLDGVVLMGADLTNNDFTGTRLRRSVLVESTLSNVTLDKVDCQGADLTDVHIEELGEVCSIAWSNDGHYLAVGGDDSNIRILDYASRKPISVLRGHNAQVLDICFLGDDLLCSLAENLIVWNFRESSEIERFDLSNVSHGTYASIECNSSSVTVTTREAKDVVRLPRYARHAFYSTKPGYDLVCRGNNEIVIRNWSKHGEEIFRSGPHQGVITIACFSPNDSLVAVGTTERKVYIWDVFTGNLLWLFEEKPVTCKGMNLEGAAGLTSGRFHVQRRTSPGTLGEWLVERGANYPELEAARAKWTRFVAIMGTDKKGPYKKEFAITFLKQLLRNSRNFPEVGIRELAEVKSVLSAHEFPNPSLNPEVYSVFQTILGEVRKLRDLIVPRSRSTFSRHGNLSRELAEILRCGENLSAKWQDRSLNLPPLRSFTKTLSGMLLSLLPSVSSEDLENLGSSCLKHFLSDSSLLEDLFVELPKGGDHLGTIEKDIVESIKRLDETARTLEQLLQGKDPEESAVKIAMILEDCFPIRVANLLNWFE